MGKSRLVREFVNSPLVAACLVLETGTISHDTTATYLSIANLLRTWFKIGERDTQAEADERNFGAAWNHSIPRSRPRFHH